ncbi:MAG: hypothetical protein KAJ48_10140 [Elusimicrobiales bacterium]|nr:hypothetical protein [Elusimicrobiales bacterium]
MTNRLQEILKQNAELEKQTPYNFCDRWCERCVFEKKSRCKIYKNELECKITCIAHGKEPNDIEITAEVMEEQYKETTEAMEFIENETKPDLENMDNPDFEKFKNSIESAQNHPIFQLADIYRKQTSSSLKYMLYCMRKTINPNLIYHFKTLQWHHTLLPAKLNRALAGFYEPADKEDMALCDAVAQLEIFKKALEESLNAFSEIEKISADLGPHIWHLIPILKQLKKKTEEFEKNI